MAGLELRLNNSRRFAKLADYRRQTAAISRGGAHGATRPATFSALDDLGNTPSTCAPNYLAPRFKVAGEAIRGLWFVRAVSATFIEASSSCANFFTRFDPPNPFNSFDPLLAAYARELWDFS